MAPPQRRYVHSRLHFHFFLKRSVAEDAAAATATCVAITVTRLTAVITVITTVSTITVTKANAKMLHSFKNFISSSVSFGFCYSLGIVRDIIPPIIGDNQAGFFLVIKLIRCDVTSQFQDRTHRHKRHKDCSHSQHELERGETNWI